MKNVIKLAALVAVILSGCADNSVGLGIGSSINGGLGVGAGISLPVKKPVIPLKDAPGVALELASPNYPAQNQTACREGDVKATFDLTDDGAAENIIIEGDDVLGAQTKQALRKSKFATGKAGRYSTTYYFRRNHNATNTRPLGVLE